MAESKAEPEVELPTSSSSVVLTFPDFLSETSGYVKDAFVDAVDPDWVCPVCAAVCRDAETSVCCQQLACRRCVTAWFTRSGRACPLCGLSPCSRDDFQCNLYIDRRVRSLNIRCPQGCGTRGLVIGLKEQTLQQHLRDDCSRRRILCPTDAASPTPRRTRSSTSSATASTGRSAAGTAVISSSTRRTRTRTTGSAATTVCPCPLVCFETAAQQTAAVSLPTSARRYYADSTSSVSVAAFTAGVLLDVLDTNRCWLVARVVQTKDVRVFVHYELWGDNWDEWLPVDSARIAPLNLHTSATSPPGLYNLNMRANAFYNRCTRARLAACDSAHPSAPSAVLPSSSSSSSSAVLTRSLIHVTAVDQHLAAVCPNRPK